MAFSSAPNKLKQSGAALVEFAVTILVFLLLTIGIAELSLLVMEFSRANELTRELSRISIVNDALCDFTDGGCPGDVDTLNCPDGGPPGDPVVVTLDQFNVGGCAADDTETECRMYRTMQAYLPTAEASNVEVTYACANTGLAFRPFPIPLVTVALRNLSRQLALGSFLGIDAAINFPDFEVSRTGEDIYTEREL